MTPDPSSDQKRDATSLRLLGGFFMVLGLAVLAGSFWELDKPRALTVNPHHGSTVPPHLRRNNRETLGAAHTDGRAHGTVD